MNKVESRYKNPDKYIDSLKRQIHNLNQEVRSFKWKLGASRNATERVQGTQCVIWKQELMDVDRQGAQSQALGVFEPGDTVINIGTVEKVIKTLNGSEIHYKLRETRRRRW